MIRVLVVDDQPLIRQGFRMILSSQTDIEVTGEEGDGNDALGLLNELAWAVDVVLLDIRMPGMDGIETARRIASAPPASAAVPLSGSRTSRNPGTVEATPPTPRVLMVTTFGHDDYVVDALRAGATGFVLKDSTPEELIHAVRVVASGESLLSPAVTSRLIARLRPAHGESLLIDSAAPASKRRADVLEQLTERELEVLAMIATGRSNAEIGEALYISEATVKSHVSHVLAKLDLRDRVQAVIVAFELGLVGGNGANQATSVENRAES